MPWPFRRKPKVEIRHVTDDWLERREREEREIHALLDPHFELFGKIEATYKKRDSPREMAKAIALCEQSIAYAPKAIKGFRLSHETINRHSGSNRPFVLPRHTAFQQLAIIREKAGDVCGALELAKEAKRQGWNGDWDKRIEKLQRKVTSN